MSITSRLPATVSISIDEFAAHGGESGANKDGWGIAFYEDGDIRRFRDTGPAASSAWVRFVERQPLCSTATLAHIRAANVGKVCLPNTHPFARELGGRMHTFAHNGYLADVDKAESFLLGGYRPIGSTDSEWAFCALLDRLAGIFREGDGSPPLDERFGIVCDFARDARDLGVANFIYCDGDVTFLHADRRRQSDGAIEPPGLWLREHVCDGETEELHGGVSICSPGQAITIAASVPLTSDDWEPLPRGTLLAARCGEIVNRSVT